MPRAFGLPGHDEADVAAGTAAGAAAAAGPCAVVVGCAAATAGVFSARIVGAGLSFGSAEEAGAVALASVWAASRSSRVVMTDRARPSSGAACAAEAAGIET